MQSICHTCPRTNIKDTADLADMRHLLMKHMQGVMAMCCKFCNSLEYYSYFYMDDRMSFMCQFLLYSHVLSTQETDGYTGDSFLDSQPTLDDFKGQVEREVLWSTNHMHQHVSSNNLSGWPRNFDYISYCFLSLIWVRVMVGSGHGSNSEQGHPAVPLPGHFHQLLRWDTNMFPSQPRCIISPTSLVCPGVSSQRSLPETSPK